ncbi:MAG: DNA-binding response regulator, partial [Hydrogenophaga sp.]|nr:DNA-binding response regulator [Hydrogenophaga sp.]
EVEGAALDRVEQALNQSAQVLAARRAQREVQQRLNSLTERERDVMNLVIAGLPNKLVADQLNISVRTVEVHRSRVFDKMGVKSAVELANALRQA